MANINWFPGHMAKARRSVAENAKLVDLILEVVDARIPVASSNPHLLEVVAHKPRVTLLCKADLAEPAVTAAWVRALSGEGREAAAFDALTGAGQRGVLAAVERIYAPVAETLAAKGFRPRPARVMVVGIPNVGKSTVINRLVGGRRAVTGNKPGVTRGKQWVRVSPTIELLDMPGILMPKIGDPKDGIRLAACGAIRDEVFDGREVAGKLLAELWARNPAGLKERFGFTALAAEPTENLLFAGRQRGLLLRGGEIDLERTAALVLKEFREGRLGRFSLEEPAGLSVSGEE